MTSGPGTDSKLCRSCSCSNGSGLRLSVCAGCFVWNSHEAEPSWIYYSVISYVLYVDDPSFVSCASVSFTLRQSTLLITPSEPYKSHIDTYIFRLVPAIYASANLFSLGPFIPASSAALDMYWLSKKATAASSGERSEKKDRGRKIMGRQRHYVRNGWWMIVYVRRRCNLH